MRNIIISDSLIIINLQVDVHSTGNLFMLLAVCLIHMSKQFPSLVEHYLHSMTMI